MKTSCAAYADMLERFLAHRITPQEFQAEFFQRFQNEDDQLDEPTFLLQDLAREAAGILVRLHELARESAT